MIVAPPFLQVGEPIPIMGKARQAARLIGVFFGLGLAGSFCRPLPEFGVVRHIRYTHYRQLICALGGRKVQGGSGTRKVPESSRRNRRQRFPTFSHSQRATASGDDALPPLAARRFASRMSEMSMRPSSGSNAARKA
jgi:hypothetical protein